MDDHRSTTTTDGDDQIIRQLQAYADGLATRFETSNPETARFEIEASGLLTAGPEPANDLDPQHGGPGRSRRAPLLAVAAVLVAMAAGWTLWRPTDPIATDTVNSSTTVTSTPTTAATETTAGTTTETAVNGTPDPSGSAGPNDPNDKAGPRLLPDPDRWAIVAHHRMDRDGFPDRSTDRSTSDEDNGIWAWRLEGVVHILVEGYQLEGLGSLDDAAVEVDNNRAIIGWVGPDGQSVGLQSIDDRGPEARAEALRAAAEQLEYGPQGWTLSDAEVLAAEPVAQPHGAAEQVDFAPVDENGIAGLRTTIIASTQPASIGSLYAELFEASSIGVVTETEIGGQPGFVMNGGFGSYALTWVDNRKTSWQGNDPGTDLSPVVASLQPVDDAEWQRRLDAIDATVEAAVDAAVAANPAELDDADLEPIATLPRFLLPEPWELEWVTDMTIWTEEQWAQRRALERAHTPAGSHEWVPLRTQAFRAVTATPSGPIAIPEIVVRTYRTDAPEEPPSVESEVIPVQVAGWQGRMETFRVDGGDMTLVYAFAPSQVLEITAPALDRDRARAFVEGLTRRGADMADGVDAGDSYELLVDLEGRAGSESSLRSRWLAGYRSRLGGANGPFVSVEALDPEQFLLTFTMRPGAGPPNVEETADGLLLVDAGRTSSRLLHYDRARQLLTIVSEGGASADELNEMFEALEPVDLATWTEVVTPINVHPTRPR